MSFLLAAITIIMLPVCGPDNSTIKEKLSFEKPQAQTSKEMITYKKVPTKWVKITKKSN